MVKKILVIGCSGSGKSTFTVKLADLTGIKAIHLDRLWWKPNWAEETRENFDQKLCKVFGLDGWIIDGNFSRTLEQRVSQADMVFRFEIGTFACVLGYFKRLISGKLGKKRNDITEGCNERLDISFVKYIIGFSKNNKKDTDELLSRYPDVKVITFTSRKDANRYINGLKKYYKNKMR